MRRFAVGPAALMASVMAAAIVVASVPIKLGPHCSLAINDAAAGNGNGHGGGNGNGHAGGNGNGNAGANSNGNAGGNGNGSVASALGGLNAGHASATAFENAAPTSRVGLMDAYSDANEAVIAAQAAYAASPTPANLAAVLTAISDAQAALDAAANKTAPTLLGDPLAGTESTSPTVEAINGLVADK